MITSRRAGPSVDTILYFYTKMDVEKLIESVRAHVCLYDLGHKQYKNIVLKNALWESIGRELNQSGK